MELKRQALGKTLTHDTFFIVGKKIHALKPKITIYYSRNVESLKKDDDVTPFDATYDELIEKIAYMYLDDPTKSEKELMGIVAMDLDEIAFNRESVGFELINPFD